MSLQQVKKGGPTGGPLAAQSASLERRAAAGLGAVVLLVVVLAAPAAAQAPTKDDPPGVERQKNALLGRAQTLQYRGNHREAIALYRRAAALKPGDLGTTLLLAGALGRLGRVEQASQAWDRWMKHSVRPDRLRLAAGNLLVPLLKAGKSGLADAVCEAWLRGSAGKNRFAALGDVYWHNGRRARAIQLYTSHLALVPGSRRELRRVVQWHREAGLVKAAAGALRTYLERAPADLEATRKLVGLLARQRRIRDVEATWNRWLAASPLPRRHALVGDHFHKARDQGMALHYYAHHLALNPMDIVVLRRVAGALHHQGRRGLVATLYRRAAEVASAPGVVREAAEVLRRMGQPEAAETAWLQWLARSRDIQRLKRVARFYLRAGKPKEAEAMFWAHLMTVQPADAEVVRILASRYLARREAPAARKVLRRFIANSESEDRRSLVARIYLRGGRVSEAVKTFTEHMKLHKEDHTSLAKFTGLLLKRGKGRLVGRLWDIYCRRSADKNRFEHAGDFFASGSRPREAMLHYSRHLATQPDDTWVVRTLSGLYLRAGKRAAAAGIWKRYLSRSTQSNRFGEAARYFMEAGQPGRAVALLLRHLGLNPRSLRAHGDLADALQKAGKIPRALTLWETATRTLSDPDRFHEAGKFYERAGLHRKAEAAFRRDLTLRPGQLASYRSLAEALIGAGKIGEAGNVWELATRRATDSDRFEEAADFFKKLGKWDRVIPLRRKHYKLNPDRWSCKALAEVLCVTGKCGQAVKLWERAVLTIKDEGRFDAAGDFFSSLGKHHRAIAMFRKNLALHPASIPAHNALAGAYRDAGRLGQGTALWDRAVRLLDDNERLMAAGEFFRSTGQPGRAAPLYRRYLVAAPRSVDARRRLGEVLRRVGKTKQAVAMWRQGMAENPGGGSFKRASEFFVSVGRHDLALGACREWVKQAPLKLEAHATLSRTLLRAGKPARAVAHLERAVSTLTDPDRFRVAGGLWTMFGRPDRALAMYRKHLSFNPRDLPAQLTLARALARARKPGQALSVAQRAVRTSTQASRHDMAGAVFKDLGRWDLAVAAYRRNLSRDTTSLPAHHSLAGALLGAGKTKQAVAVWERAVRTLNADYRFSWAGDFFKEIGRLDRAEALYRKHLALSPADTSALGSLSGILLSRGKLKEAVSLWERALRTLVTHSVHDEAGSFFSGIGRPARALALYRKNLALNPTERGAHDHLAELLSDMGRSAEAVKIWDAGLKACHDPYCLLRAGRLHQQLGNYQRAASLKRQYVRRRPADIEGYRALADTLLASGKVAEADKVWQRGLRLGPNHRFRAAADFYRRMGKLDRALPLYRRHLALNPGSCHAYRDLAKALRAAGKAREAHGVWRVGLRRCKEDYGKEFAADHFRDSGKFLRAISLYRTYLSNHPTDRSALISLARCLLAARRPREAEAVLLRAAPSKGLEFRLEALGNLYVHTGQKKKAMALFQQHVLAAPGDSKGHRRLAGELLAAGKKSRARDVWSRGLRRCTDQFCRGYAADFFQVTGQCSRAIPLYRRIISAGHHRNIHLRSHLARCLGTMGKTAEASRHLGVATSLAKKLERQVPSDYFPFRGEAHFEASVLNGAAWFYLVHQGTRRHWKHALALARRASALLPANEGIRGTLIIALYRNGLAAEAAPMVVRRLAREPWSAWGHLEAALVYRMLGKKGLARRHLARFRKLRSIPDTETAEFERELIAIEATP